MAATFPEPNGLLIYGARCTGKTTLELNLRKAVLGSCNHRMDYASNERICFLGRTTRKRNSSYILSTAGAELLTDLDYIPKIAKTYIASITPGYDKAKVIEWFSFNLQWVTVITLFSKNRQKYYEKRCKQYTGFCLSELGPAKMLEPPIGDMVEPFSMEQLSSAFVAGLTFLGLDTEREIDYDISCRTYV